MAAWRPFWMPKFHFLAHLGGLLRWQCVRGPSSVDGITFWWKFSEREELGLPNLAWPCIPIGGTYTPKFVLIRSKMAVWRPFWMPKFHFLTYLAGNFRNHISYEFDILQECVALLGLQAYQKTRSSDPKWPTGGHLCLWKMTLFANFQSFLIFCS